jgi:hypothetical protein
VFSITTTSITATDTRATGTGTETTGVHVVTAVRDRGITATECITIVIAIAMTGVIVATIAGVTDRPTTDTSVTILVEPGHAIVRTIATAAMTMRVMHATAMMPVTATVMAGGRHRVATAGIRATGATATALVHLTATQFDFGRAMPGPTPNAAEREHRKI